VVFFYRLRSVDELTLSLEPVLHISVVSATQSEGMGILEFQPMPSLTVFCVHLVIDQPQTGENGVSGQAARTIHHVQNHTLAGSLSFSHAARRAAVLASSLAFCLIGTFVS
jgi:hypothetical protein